MRKCTHLDDGACDMLLDSDDERIRYIQRDRFIPYQAVESILGLLGDFVTRPVSIRPPCLALVGDSGCGKSTLVAELEHRFKDASDPNTRKVVVCTMDPLPEIRVSQRALMTALGIPPTMALYRPRVDGDDLIARSLKEWGTRLVGFDETLHLENLGSRARALQWDWIKWVSTANRVSVVCTGIPGFEQTIRDEAQLETRFSIMRIPRWTVGPPFGQFLSSFERSLPLRRPSGLGVARMQGEILKESALMQQIGGITQVSSKCWSTPPSKRFEMATSAFHWGRCPTGEPPLMRRSGRDRRPNAFRPADAGGRVRLNVPSLPLICHPYLDETFGSWLHRCADAYCTTTGRFADSVLAMAGELPITAQVDWDTAPPPQLLRALTKVSPFTQSELEYLVVAATPAILPPHYRDTYCPTCFIEDSNRGSPYFRRAWLDAWTIHCPTHGCLLGL